MRSQYDIMSSDRQYCRIVQQFKFGYAVCTYLWGMFIPIYYLTLTLILLWVGVENFCLNILDEVQAKTDIYGRVRTKLEFLMGVWINIVFFLMGARKFKQPLPPLFDSFPWPTKDRPWHGACIVCHFVDRNYPKVWT